MSHYLRHPLMHWLLSHIRACRYAVTELFSTPFSNGVVIAVVAIAISLPLGFFVLLQNLQTANGAWHAISAPTISLFLNSTVSQTQIDSIIITLNNNPAIKKVSYISAEDGLKSFEKNTPFSNVISLFHNNPIPPVLIITPNKENQNPAAIQQLFSTLQTLPIVDTAQLDLNWATRLYDIIMIGKNITKALSLLFGFSVLVIIGHTLRHSLAKHAKEILVLRLIGATRSYIRRPLLYRGILYGLLGGCVAWVLVDLFIAQLQPAVLALAETYHTQFQLQIPTISQGIVVLLITSFLGFLSAWVNATHFLNKPELID